MDIPALTIDARRLWAGESAVPGALAFVDLDATQEWPEAPELPPCPVIGLGAREHPFAAQLDAVIEPPVGAESLARQVLAQPEAAAVIVQLLRTLPGLSPQHGLTAESLAYGLLQGSAGHRRWMAAQAPPETAAESPRQVHVARSDDRLTITLDHAPSGNAIDRTMRDALYEAFALAALDVQLRAVVLRGAGRTFSLGAELGEFGTTTDPATAHAIRARTLPVRMIARLADRLEVEVHGGCVGAGLEMAAWGARVTAGPSAWFQLPELAMGILPGAGGCVALTRRIGRQRSALLILSGKRIGVRTALAWGLVDALVDDPA